MPCHDPIASLAKRIAAARIHFLLDVQPNRGSMQPCKNKSFRLAMGHEDLRPSDRDDAAWHITFASLHLLQKVKGSHEPALQASSRSLFAGGVAQIEGHSLQKDMTAVYKTLGTCPQENLLWDSLTGREHLLYYARLRGLQVRQLTMLLALGSNRLLLHAVTCPQ